MRTDQYVYLGVWSDSLTADQIAAVIGLAPDTTMTKGSERADPPVPRSHRWAVECRDPGVQIDVQIDLLVGRLRPHLDGLRRIAAVSVGLQMVRYFHSPDGQDDVEGWCLGPDVLEFPASVPASVDSDENDLTPD